MVNLAVFFDHIGHARTGDHQNLDGLSLFQVVVRNPGREFFHQLLFQKPRIIDLFEGRSLKTLGLVRLKTQFQKEVHPPASLCGALRYRSSSLCLSRSDYGAG